MLVRRGGQDQALAARRPAPAPAAAAPAADAGDAGLAAPRPEDARRSTPEYVAAASPKLRGGLYVQAVSPGSPGARASIQKGDILVGMNVGARHWETIRPDNILFILRQPEVAHAQTAPVLHRPPQRIHQGV